MNSVSISVVNRIHMFVYNYLHLSFVESNGFAGGAGLALDSGIKMNIELTKNDFFLAQHSSVLQFFCKKFKETVSYSGGISVSVNQVVEEHIGYGSTISLVTAMLFGINFLLDFPLDEKEIKNLIHRYYCEDSNGKLVKGFDTGVGVVCSLYGGLNFVRNENEHYNFLIPENYCVLTFIPQLKPFEKKLTIEYEYIRLQKIYDREIAEWSVKERYINNSFIPNINEKKIQEIGKDILKLHQIGSKRVECEEYNYSLQMEMIHHLHSCGACIAGMSSAGPCNFVVIEENAIESVINGIRQFCPNGSIRRFEIAKKGMIIL